MPGRNTACGCDRHGSQPTWVWTCNGVRRHAAGCQDAHAAGRERAGHGILSTLCGRIGHSYPALCPRPVRFAALLPPTVAGVWVKVPTLQQGEPARPRNHRYPAAGGQRAGAAWLRSLQAHPALPIHQLEGPRCQCMLGALGSVVGAELGGIREPSAGAPNECNPDGQSRPGLSGVRQLHGVGYRDFT